MAATLGAGEQDYDVFQALAQNNAVTVGGTYDVGHQLLEVTFSSRRKANSRQTVGIVGWATSGGHGWLTSSYGQGADNIYEVEIVTPQGRTLIANECQNTDIFWATRGGGGGTFGVITKITMKAYAMPTTAQWVWNVVSQNGTSAHDWWAEVASLHATLVEIHSEGFQGYYTMTGSASGPWTFGGYFLAYNKSNATIQSLLAPFSTQLNETSAGSLQMWNLSYFDTWIEAFNGLPKQGADNSDGPGGVISVTRLLARDDLTKDMEAVTRMFEGIAPNSEEAEVCFPPLHIENYMSAEAKQSSLESLDISLLAA
jgi:hypothetical protein